MFFDERNLVLIKCLIIVALLSGTSGCQVKSDDWVWLDASVSGDGSLLAFSCHGPNLVLVNLDDGSTRSIKLGGELATLAFDQASRKIAVSQITRNSSTVLVLDHETGHKFFLPGAHAEFVSAWDPAVGLIVTQASSYTDPPIAGPGYRPPFKYLTYTEGRLAPGPKVLPNILWLGSEYQLFDPNGGTQYKIMAKDGDSWRVAVKTEGLVRSLITFSTPSKSALFFLNDPNRTGDLRLVQVTAKGKSTIRMGTSELNKIIKLCRNSE